MQSGTVQAGEAAQTEACSPGLHPPVSHEFWFSCAKWEWCQRGRWGENVCMVNWPSHPDPYVFVVVCSSAKGSWQSLPALLDSKQHLQTEAIIILVNCHVYLNSSLKCNDYRSVVLISGQRGSESCFVPRGLLCGYLSDLENPLCSPHWWVTGATHKASRSRVPWMGEWIQTTSTSFEESLLIPRGCPY